MQRSCDSAPLGLGLQPPKTRSEILRPQPPPGLSEVRHRTSLTFKSLLGGGHRDTPLTGTWSSFASQA